MKNNYSEVYNSFMESYKSGATDAARVGEVIAELAQHFSEANIDFTKRDISYKKVAAEFEMQRDPETGKPYSSSRAQTLASASPEAAEAMLTKAHLVNIETCINSLKSLQKGLLNEYAHMGNT